MTVRSYGVFFLFLFVFISAALYKGILSLSPLGHEIRLAIHARDRLQRAEPPHQLPGLSAAPGQHTGRPGPDDCLPLHPQLPPL